MMTADPRPALTAGALNELIDDYLAGLRGQIPDALHADLTLWTVLADLLTHAGVEREDWHPALQACDELTIWCRPDLDA